MTPQQAAERLALAAENGWIRLDDVLDVLPRIRDTPDGLTITDEEAGLLLALLDGKKLPPEGIERLAVITGRLQTISTATGTHRLDDADLDAWDLLEGAS